VHERPFEIQRQEQFAYDPHLIDAIAIAMRTTVPSLQSGIGPPTARYLSKVILVGPEETGPGG
jgi:hypothetical protein